jgi:hypothetical protein
MPLYVFQCTVCKEVTRKLLKSRPTIYNCCCGGKLAFVTDTQSMVLEKLDNGLMPRSVERLSNIEELRETRSKVDLTVDPKRGNLV